MCSVESVVSAVWKCSVYRSSNPDELLFSSRYGNSLVFTHLNLSLHPLLMQQRRMTVWSCLWSSLRTRSYMLLQIHTFMAIDLAQSLSNVRWVTTVWWICFGSNLMSLLNFFSSFCLLQFSGQRHVPSGFGCQDIRGAGQGRGTRQHSLWIPWDFQCCCIDVCKEQIRLEMDWMTKPPLTSN